MNIEQWKDEVMSSYEGMERAKPSADLFDKISSEIDFYEPKYIPKKNVALMLAGILLLVVLNFYAIKQYRANITPMDSETVEKVNVQYALISDFKLYE